MSALLIIRDQQPLIAALDTGTPSARLSWVNAQETYHRMDEIDGEHDPEDYEKQRPSFYLPRVPAPELRIDYLEFDLTCADAPRACPA